MKKGDMDMTKGAILPQILIFALPLILGQLFQQLYYSADVKHGGRLPVHVHFVMDEFANETQL